MDQRDLTTTVTDLLHQTKELKSSLYNLKFNLAVLTRNITRLKTETQQAAQSFYELSGDKGARLDEFSDLRKTGS